MTLHHEVEAKLKAAGVFVGDLVEVSSSGGTTAGILMPHSDYSDPRAVVLKLDSGYNIGLRVDDSTVVRLREHRKPKAYAGSDEPLTGSPAPPRGFIALIGTGGTIASYVDYETGAVNPALTSRELATAVPEVMERYPLRPIALFSVFSENLRFEHWVRLAEEIAAQVEEGAAGIVIPHGTDTMAYTAAALAFAIENPPVPIVLVGSQRSSDRPSSDAALNLMCAAKTASSDLAEVLVVMHDRTGDDRCAVHLGVRVRKMHSSARSAFRSINARPLATCDGNALTFTPGATYRKRSGGRKVALRALFEGSVALLSHYPNFPPSLLEAAISRCKGVVIAGTGLGHVGEDLIPLIARACERGYPVVMTTQCIYGGTGLGVYSTGRKLIKAGVIDAGDTLSEVAVVKLMWALANAKSAHEVREIMQRNLVGERGLRRTFEGSGEDEP